jgi:hypothetical protein
VSNSIDRKECRSVAAAISMAACVGLAAALVASGCSSGPVADGPTLLSSRCSTCHSPQRGQTTKRTAAEWEQIVTRMVGKGAKVNNAEKAVLVEYLAKITAQ